MTDDFPYVVITEDERDKDFEKLQKCEYEENLRLRRIGNKTSNYYFQKHRVRTKTGKWSHWTAWYDPEKRKKILEACEKLYKKNNRRYSETSMAIRYTLQMSVGSINQFKPYIAVSGVYKKFNPKRILDISAGWGDRLIGAMSQSIDYIGIDQNIKLEESYNNMINDFKDKSKSEVLMIFKKSQDVDYSSLPKYDLIFTSPPYFYLEKYEGMEIFKTKEEFIEKYWKPTIEKAYKHLEAGGHMALNMPLTMYDAIKPLVGDAEDTIKMPINNRFGYKKAPPKFENIYIWKKREPRV